MIVSPEGGCSSSYTWLGFKPFTKRDDPPSASMFQNCRVFPVISWWAAATCQDYEKRAQVRKFGYSGHEHLQFLGWLEKARDH